MKEPELVSATQEQRDELLELAKPALSERQYRLLEGMLGTFVYVMLKLQNATTSLRRFQQMLFGARTAHKRNLAVGPGPSSASAPALTTDTAAVDDDPAVQAALVPRQPKPGHGRNAAPIVECEHSELKSGERCPQCQTGRVDDSPPRTLVKVIGQAPLGATVYRLQRLRCRLCDALFTAPLPAGVAALPKYDASCASMIALLRDGNGLPHFRLEGLQASL